LKKGEKLPPRGPQNGRKNCEPKGGKTTLLEVRKKKKKEKTKQIINKKIGSNNKFQRYRNCSECFKRTKTTSKDLKQKNC